MPVGGTITLPPDAQVGREGVFESHTQERNLAMQTERINLPPSVRMEALVHYGHRCIYCGATSKDAKLQVDHVIPVSKGGTNEMGNLVVACWTCNIGKGNRMLLEITEGDAGVYVNTRRKRVKPVQALSQEVPEEAWAAQMACDDMVGAWLPHFRRYWSSVDILPDTIQFDSVGKSFQFSPTFVCRGREGCDLGGHVRVLVTSWFSIGGATPEEQSQIRNAVISGYDVPTVIIMGPPKFFFGVAVTERYKGTPRGHVVDEMLQPLGQWDGDGWYPDESWLFEDLRSHVPSTSLHRRRWDVGNECFVGVFSSIDMETLNYGI